MICSYLFDFGIEFLVQNLENSIRNRSQSAMERPKQAKSVILLTFLTHFRDPNFPRYCQDLYQGHTSHSRLSSLSMGLLYLLHPLPILALQNFFEFFWYSQSLYKTHIRETLVSSLPIGFFHNQHRHIPITIAPKLSDQPLSKNRVDVL